MLRPSRRNRGEATPATGTTLRRAGKRVARKGAVTFGPGKRKLLLRVGRHVKGGRALVRTRLIDAAGDRVIDKQRVRLPKP